MKKIIFGFLLLVFSSSWLVINQAKAFTINLNELLGNQEELLTVDEAFKLQVEVLDNNILVKFEIAEDYYMYRERFAFNSDNATLGEALMPEGKVKDDPYFGMTEVYHNFFEASVPFSNAQSEINFSVDFQGCATDRLCYPPTTRTVTLAIDGVASVIQKGATTEFVSEQDSLITSLEDNSAIWNFFKFILIGLGLTFTPCVFPMIPIISGIIAGQGKDISTRRAFGLSLTYTQAVAIVYAIFGVLVALAGKSLSGYLQSPFFVIGAAIVFVILSLSMFGFYELQLPASLQAKLANKSNSQKGGYIGTAIMGAISALIVSPCVTVPLIAILLFIAQSGDLFLGATALYGLGIGMGIPLIIIAVTEGKFLPKAGPWMDGIKAAFGVAMLAVALYLIKHLLPNSIYMYGWALLSIIPGFFLLKNQLAHTGWSNLFKAVGLILMIYGALLMVGGAKSNRDLLNPLKNGISDSASISKQSHLPFERIKTLAQLEEMVTQANAQGKTVMLDFFAEWCAACYEFEALVFSDAKVAAALSNTLLLQADVTANDAADVELMEAFEVLGLPSIMFFDAQGNELPKFRATGFEDAQTFEKRIKAAFNP
ncbi:MAG: protein-disulfide reductase DsbD [Kangiellaceae bacterium]|nr:protein-disulfide reductase DsbD [Kangiellaceae bacterium]